MHIDIAAWYEKYGPMVIRRCRSILGNEDDALDAVQDVFLNLLRSRERLHGRFPSSLLYTMATNVCLNRLRVKGREIPAGSFLADEEMHFFRLDRDFDRVEARLLIDLILKDESELNRLISFMYYADEMTFKEIGEAVGLSISGVRKRLEGLEERARRKLAVSRTRRTK
jgi:RNA polymerase sigma-70 factor (ECF subfamily)